MSIASLYISFFIFVAILLAALGYKYLNERIVEINKFKPNYSKEDSHVKVQKEQTLTTSKKVFIIVAGGLSIGVLVYAIAGNLLFSVISSFAGLIFPRFWYKWYAKNQGKIISKQMDKVAETMAAVLKTENNIVAALERASFDCEEPLKSMLNKASNEIRLGIPTNVAFESLAKSINVPEMITISVGIELQQQGMAINMASMLEQVQKNIRNRQSIEAELNAITAENKMSGWIVAVIPFATLTLIRLTNPDFVAPLFTTPVGLGIFSICVFVIAVGLYWLLRIAEMK